MKKEYQMQHKIGTIAGNIFNKLESGGEMTPRKISSSINEKTDVVYMALGWLARENKVEFNATKSTFKVRVNK
jgi:hypothetical protein